MNEQERIALLEQVAECAPKGWTAKLQAFLTRSDALVFHYFENGTHSSALLSFESDYRDALAITAMLNAIESKGFACGVATARIPESVGSYYNKNGEGYDCVYQDQNEEPCRRFNHKTNGSTRSEAVARAFVKVFRGVQS